MISDILYTAVREIDRYLEESDMYHDNDGQPDPEIVRVRNEMFDLLLDLDHPEDRLKPEYLDARKKMLAEKRTPSWRPWMNV